MLEIVWSKYLSYLLGNSVLGVATVVASFLGGLGAGAAIGGRLAARTQSPLRVYARLEMLVGILALASPLAQEAARPLFASVYAALEGNPAPFLLVRFLILFAALFVPTMAMGATLPLAVAELSRRGSTAPDPIVGRLYAVNTAGGVVGVVAAGFLLVPSLGLWKSACLAGLIDLTVAFVVLSRRPAGVPAAVLPAGPGPGRREGLSSGQIGALVLAALSGFTAILYQIAWTRILIVPFGGMVYAFSAILATYLGGIALGALGVARLLRRTRAVWVVLGLFEIALAGAVVSGAHLFDELPHLITSVIAGSFQSPGRLYAGEVGITALIVLVPTLLLGALFPVLVAAYRRGRLEPGSAVGAIYAANTIGSIGGSLATAFFLVPLLGALGSVLLACGLNAAIGVGALLFAGGPSRWRRPAALAAAAAAVLVAVAAPPRTSQGRATLGFVRLIRAVAMGGERMTHRVIDAVTASSRHQQVLFHRQGRVADVSVIRTGETLALLVNGKADATVARGLDMTTQVLLGQLPLLFAREPRDVCIVGYGSGATTQAVLTHPIREALTVEIEPAVVEAGVLFREFVGEPLADPRSRLLVEDAGTYLRSSARRFDVIISEPSNLWIAGMADLFTRDFYRAARGRLRPGGVFCQWVQCYQTSPATLSTVFRTFTSVFPHGQAFYVDFSEDLILLASPDRELRLEPESLAAGMATPEAARNLAGMGILTPADLLRFYRGRIESFVQRAGPGTINTDDNAFLEHRAPYDLLEGDTSGPLFAWPPSVVSDLASELSRQAGGAELLRRAIDRAAEEKNEPAAEGLRRAREALAARAPLRTGP
ncbi:MAG TPA: fused MFS/spermidine synthase [Candidatus Eisenbacteria bacterium]|jgi:spermidine synthase